MGHVLGFSLCMSVCICVNDCLTPALFKWRVVAVSDGNSSLRNLLGRQAPVYPSVLKGEA